MKQDVMNDFGKDRIGSTPERLEPGARPLGTGEARRLELWTRAVLEQLPLRKVPSGIASEILLSVQAYANRPWYRRTWLEWPRGWQCLSFVGLIGLVALWGWVLDQGISSALSSPWVEQTCDDGSLALNFGETLGYAMLNALNQIPNKFWLMSAGVFAMAWSALFALGTACWRLATVHSQSEIQSLGTRQSP